MSSFEVDKGPTRMNVRSVEVRVRIRCGGRGWISPGSVYDRYKKREVETIMVEGGRFEEDMVGVHERGIGDERNAKAGVGNRQSKLMCGRGGHRRAESRRGWRVKKESSVSSMPIMSALFKRPARSSLSCASRSE